MKAMVVDKAFGLENLSMVERPQPEPGPGEVLLEMKAASLNYRDLLTVRGHYNPRQPLPLVPCSDGCGEVVAVGEGVRRVATGQRVAPIFNQRWLSGAPSQERIRSTLGGPIDGTLQRQMVLPAESVVAVPTHLSAAEAACLPCAALTAWSALFVQGDLQAGQTVLLQGTGGVSLFALQLAKIAGAKVIACSSSEEKLSRLRELGADAVFNYKEQPRWGRWVKELTSGAGVDQIVDVGGAETLNQALSAIKVGGTISVIGMLSGTQPKLNIIPLLMHQVRLQGILVGSRDGFEAMNRAIEAAELHPVIDRSFALEQTKAAFEHMASGAHFGKITIEIE